MQKKLEIGYSDSFEVRHETVFHTAAKPIRLLYLSDLHLTGHCGKIAAAIATRIEELNPSLILLGGDYADSNRGLDLFSWLLNQLRCYTVVAIAGNHDYFFGIKKVEKAITATNGHWIEKKSISLSVDGVPLVVHGNAVMEGCQQDALQVMCLHKPLPVEKLNNYNLVFAGHLHGGQLVWWQIANGLFPGRFFYKQNFLNCKLPQGHYFISKGLGDTFPVRYNCKRDLIMVDVVPAKNGIDSSNK